MTDAADVRRFAVHARHEDRHHARVVAEPSFEAAVVAFLETGQFAAEPDVVVVVRDLDSGAEHCFRIDLETGETTACG